MKTIGEVSNTVATKPLTVIEMDTVELAIIKLIRTVIVKKHPLSIKAGLLLFCLFSSPAHAQNYYVCNNGSDSNTGLSIFEPWATFDFAMSRFGTLNAGDAVLFCRNGTFTSSYPRLFNQHCASDAPCTLADYIPPNIAPADAKLPVITSSSANGVLNFQDGGNADHDEGYVIKNLSLRGNGTGNGIFLFNDVDYVTVDGVTIGGFAIGVHSAGANTPNPGANKVNENIALRNSTIINNRNQGWLGGCNDCVIDNNKFTNNGFAQKIFNHNIYISGANNSGITISNNTLNKAAFVAGKCAGVSLVVHGVVQNLTIQGNTVFEAIGAVEQSCWGISVDPGYATEESFSNVIITGNKVTNVGNVGIGCASCTNLQILDNTIVHSQDFGFTGIRIPVRTEDTVKSDRILITGNFVELQDPNKRGKQGIVVTSTGDVNVGSNEVIFH
jgi:hypothetical protein